MDHASLDETSSSFYVFCPSNFCAIFSCPNKSLTQTTKDLKKSGTPCVVSGQRHPHTSYAPASGNTYINVIGSCIESGAYLCASHSCKKKKNFLGQVVDRSDTFEKSVFPWSCGSGTRVTKVQPAKKKYLSMTKQVDAFLVSTTP